MRSCMEDAKQPIGRSRMTQHARMALVGDIGHTNLRLAIADIDELTVGNYASLSTPMFSGIAEAIGTYLKSVPDRPALAGFSVAGSVSENGASIDGLGWTFTRDDIASACGADRVHIVGDTEAVAIALPHLVPHDLHPLGGGEPAAGAPRLVIAPGTRLGVAALIGGDEGAHAMTSHAGLIGFAAETAEEFALLDEVTADAPGISADSVLGARGLMKLARILAHHKGKRTSFASPAALVKAALDDKDAEARMALTQYVRWLARYTADMALAYDARGGVYLNGLARHIVPALDDGGFRHAFDERKDAGGLLRTIPVHVVRAADAGLRGAAAALAGAIARAGSTRHGKAA